MKPIKNYKEFILNENINNKVFDFDTFINMKFDVNPNTLNGKKHIIESLNKINYMNMSSSGFYDLIIENNLYLKFFDNNINEDTLFVELMLNEDVKDSLIKGAKTLAGWAKKGIKGVGDVIKEWPNEIAQAVVKLGADLKGLITWVIKGVNDAIKTLFEFYKSKAKSKQNEIQENISKKIGKETSSKLNEVGPKEIKGVGAIAKALWKAITEAPKKWESAAKQAAGFAQKELKDDNNESVTIFDYIENSIYESISQYILKNGEDGILEIQNFDYENFDFDSELTESEGHGSASIPFISSVKTLLLELPPWKLFKEVEHYLGSDGNKGLTSLDDKMKKYGSTGLHYVVIGVIAAECVSTTLEFAHMNPLAKPAKWFLTLCGLSIVYHALPWIAGAILAISISESLIKGSDNHDDKHDDKKHESFNLEMFNTGNLNEGFIDNMKYNRKVSKVSNLILKEYQKIDKLDNKLLDEFLNFMLSSLKNSGLNDDDVRNFFMAYMYSIKNSVKSSNKFNEIDFNIFDTFEEKIK